ncbi:glycosyl hydrolase family 8 [Devosia rhizoryzae]|uniref:cellulase n=1 Tax=Devosia rhizoryzae TaxID=2774137 RepID=A0ABX7C320_9HYPH|nr:glycosyl hydrolase family 8 [Devosia rhizoryzae]QQR38628.1 endoglucanase [Devosia rhizoryzae]
MKALRPLAAILLANLLVMPAHAQSLIQPAEWQAYRDAFVEDSGRVVDTANGGISHSEGQGYGLWLSVLAQDRPSFERILSFTRTELMLRDDGLAAWRWEPDSEPHVPDTNNATDGDMLIAYALYQAGTLWSDEGYAEQATSIVRTIGRTMITMADGLPAISPGALGFDGADLGPVLNLSYWIFEALPVFGEIDPETDWSGIYQTGLEIARRAAVTKAGLPPDWLTLDAGGLVPAPDFPPEFGYNNIRIPLYMMRAEIDPAYLGPYRRNADAAGLYKINVRSGARIEPIGEPGYQLIRAAMECVAAGTAVPEDLRTMSPTSYYAATLQLLLLDHLRRSHAECLEGAG